MLGQKNKEIPTEKVIEMQKQGVSNSDIISNLQDKGYKHDQISNAMNQASVKGELSNSSFINQDPIPESNNIPTGLMDAPSPSDSSKEYYSPREFNVPEPSNFAPEPTGRSSYDEIEEIAESIIKEKWDDLLKGVGDIRVWKEKVDVELEGVKQEIVRTQEKFESLQKAVMGKVKEYSDSVSNINTEMRALEKVLEKILSPLTKSVKDLQEVSEKMSKRKIPTRKTPIKKRTTKRKTKKKTTRKKKK